MINLYTSHSASSKSFPSLKTLLPRLDALLMVTKSCSGDTCRQPWKVIHPQGDVASLSDALNTKFDDFYASVSQKVGFEECMAGYVVGNEGSQDLGVIFEEGVVYEEEHGEL